MNKTGHLLMAGGLLALVLWAVPLAAEPGDARQGAKLLRSAQCTLCHPLLGVGGETAPDLGRRSLRQLSAASMAAMMWNHGPEMWRQMAGWSVEPPRLSVSDLQSLYAYFYSLRFFEPPGEASRGQAAFVSKSCNRCHPLVAMDAGALAPPVPEWRASTDRVLWLQQMWNHGGSMAVEMERQGISWPRFTIQEMADLMVFVEELPGVVPGTPALRFGDPAEGRRLFHSHACESCHTIGRRTPGKRDLLAAAEGRNLTGLAVAMWNQSPVMRAAADSNKIEWKPFQAGQMEQLLSFLLEQRYLEPSGNAQRGARVFEAKLCRSCHEKAVLGAPAVPRSGSPYSAYRFAADAWRHGPIMDANLDALGMDWPQLSEADVADLIAFLNRPSSSQPERAPE